MLFSIPVTTSFSFEHVKRKKIRFEKTENFRVFSRKSAKFRFSKIFEISAIFWKKWKNEDGKTE